MQIIAKEQKMTNRPTNVLKKLSSFSILKAMYMHEFELYTDCFIPIVLQAMSRRESSTIDDINNELNSFFPLPILLIQKILERAVTKKYINVQMQTVNNKNVDIFRLVKDYEKKLMVQPEHVTKRISEFVEDVNEYFKEHEFHADRSVLNIVESFIDEEIFLTNFIKIPHLSDIEFPVARNDMKCLLCYLRQREIEKSKYVQTFTEIIKGSIIANALEWTDIDSINISNYKQCKIFIDTNTMFSILGMHGIRMEEAMCDLIDKLRFYNFKLYVFDFTIKQINLVLDDYKPSLDVKNVKGIEGSFYQRPSVYETLKNKKWNYNDISRYKDEIVSKIEGKGINIMNTNLELQSGDIGNYPELEMLCIDYSIQFADRKRKYPFDSNAFGKLHDFAAIYCIKKYRDFKPVNLNNPKAIFLTSDRQLTRFNQIDMIHDEYELPEVILDTGLASMLWFLYKEISDINFSIELIISAYTNNNFISENVWKQYQKVILNMIENEDLDILQLPNLYFKNLHRDLCEIPSENASSEINTNFIKNGIRKSVEEEKKLKSQLKEVIDEKVGIQKVMDTIHNKINNMKIQIDTISKSKKIWEWAFFIVLFCLIIILIILFLK